MTGWARLTGRRIDLEDGWRLAGFVRQRIRMPRWPVIVVSHQMVPLDRHRSLSPAGISDVRLLECLGVGLC